MKTVINSSGLDYRELNEKIRTAEGDCRITECLGQRFIGAGLSGKTLEIEGVPGNALGAYLNGGRITVFGNGQDAVGDTMNAGRIEIRGNIGDTAGYAMRGGEILVQGNAGYRAGIHMKAYKDRFPVMVIGGRAGSFLGEYQAGGLIILFGLHWDGKSIIGNFPCTGMHGGKLIFRGSPDSVRFPSQVSVSPAGADDLLLVRGYAEQYCACFGVSFPELFSDPYTVVVPDSRNPYRQMYAAN